MKIYLRRKFFRRREFVLAEQKNMRAVAFRYSTGVEALRIENERGYFIILPFQGQQIWRAVFDGKELTMKTKFEEPIATTEYLKTYGGFLLHCGISAIGTPQKDDTHVQHGEIPNALYQEVYLECGDDYMSVGGHLDYNISFVRNYVFSPKCTLYDNDTVLKVDVELENRRQSPMEYMYLCHINFRPIDGAELIYSATCDRNNIKLYPTVSGNMPKEEREKLEGYLKRLSKEPQIHHKIGGKEQIYNPEICFGIKYRGDEQKRAYTLQYTEEGACYVNHPVDILPVGIRWISRTGDEDAMGMVLPATSEHLGYNNAKQKGQVKILPPHGRIHFYIEAGYLEKERANLIKEKIAMLQI